MESIRERNACDIHNAHNIQRAVWSTSIGTIIPVEMCAHTQIALKRWQILRENASADMYTQQREKLDDCMQVRSRERAHTHTQIRSSFWGRVPIVGALQEKGKGRGVIKADSENVLIKRTMSVVTLQLLLQEVYRLQLNRPPLQEKQKNKDLMFRQIRAKKKMRACKQANLEPAAKEMTTWKRREGEA